ncbi:MAG: hypothetical protein CMP91_01140 [Gammaproteobacteria bacterium]|nr:hypothetical protein [Gammaproteobacteria bacterium]|tara:strand:+ start:6132 stop:6899 length:768 start_codon:yes stop_codon:yes gene_type:complete
MNNFAAQLVAHRGQIADYPENTLESLTAAIACGARFLEVDVQLSADHIPILCHDATLERTGGKKADVRSLPFTELQRCQVGEVKRLGEEFPAVFIPSLQQAISLLKENPEVQLFIELKQESFDHFGIEVFVDQVLSCIKSLATQVIVISFNHDALVYLKQKSTIRSGWIIRKMNRATLQQAAELNPQFMFIKHKACTKQSHDFSADAWDWVLYETSDPQVARELFKRGVAYVESNDICKLLHYFREAKIQENKIT